VAIGSHILHQLVSLKTENMEAMENQEAFCTSQTQILTKHTSGSPCTL